jgi:hypothetical protein
MFAKGFLYFLFVCFVFHHNTRNPKADLLVRLFTEGCKPQLELLPKPISKGQIIFSRCNGYRFDYRGS